jgi:hypothetical protein
VKLGIGGKVGPFRAGVSTRGFGVGAGPLKATSGYGSRGGGDSGGPFALAVGFILILSLIALALGLALALAILLLPCAVGFYVVRRSERLIVGVAITLAMYLSAYVAMPRPLPTSWWAAQTSSDIIFTAVAWRWMWAGAWRMCAFALCVALAFRLLPYLSAAFAGRRSRPGDGEKRKGQIDKRRTRRSGSAQEEVALPFDGTVQVVEGRPRYHVDGCRYLTGKDADEMPVGDARDRGFTACTICKPDETLAVAPTYRAGVSHA